MIDTNRAENVMADAAVQSLQRTRPQTPAPLSSLAQQTTAELRRVLREQGWALLLASGGSMLPFVRPGDLIECRPAGIDEITVGDVVLYALGDRIVNHRVVRRLGGRRLLTRGDNRLGFDLPIGEDALIGRATTLRRGGREIRQDRRPVNLARLTLSLPGALLIAALVALKTG